jgi:membrane-bound metal-dependent hydrolase YbcI (DUF457 family)
MQGHTHRAGGLVFMTVGFEVMKQHNLLIPDVNPYLQLAVMYPISQWGSTFPDLDHHWDATPDKSPINWVVHKLLHLSHPKHRSWQTHSLLVTGGFLLLLYTLVLVGDQYWLTASATDWLLIRMLVVGVILGISSHLFLDLINPSGIHLIPGIKIHLVPKTHFFATGGTWEAFIIYPLCMLITALVVVNVGLGLLHIDAFTTLAEAVKTITSTKG